MNTTVANGSGPEQGFSILRLIAVVIILALLAVALSPLLVAWLYRPTPSTKAIETILTLDEAVRQYGEDHGGRKPETLLELIQPSELQYLEATKVPVDPWGREFVYRPPSSPEGDDYDIVCLGADVVPGGEGEDRDIRLSEIKHSQMS